jgi:hypothetical protein
MKESVISEDKSCIFRETFNDAYSVANNEYAKGTVSATGCKFEDGVAKFNGSTGYINYSYKFYPKNKCYRWKLTYKKVTSGNQFLLYINKLSHLIYVYIDTSNQLVYQDASIGTHVITTLINESNYEIIFRTSDSTIYVNSNPFIFSGVSRDGAYDFITSYTNFQIGLVTNNCNLQFELFEIYNRSLTANEVKLLYQNQLYVQPTNLPLLLDFDSTQGLLLDKTGLNTLTPTNVEIRKIGKVYSAYFNGSNSKIDISNIITNNCNIIVSAWVLSNEGKASNRDFFGNNAYAFGKHPTGNTFYVQKGNNVRYAFGTANLKVNHILVRLIDLYPNTTPSISARCYFNGTYISGTPSDQTLAMGNFTWIGRGKDSFWKGFIPSLKVINAIGFTDNQVDLLSAQIYNSQKRQFGL